MAVPEIRAEESGDAAAIRAVLLDAFETDAEANLVDALRTAEALSVSLVAVHDGEIVGHVAFSPVTIEGEGRVAADVSGLAPVAVNNAHQRQGIGSALIRAGLEAVRTRATPLVIVLGSPDYYPRFGFSRASAMGIRWEHDAPDEAFMAMALQPGAAQTRAGIARYHPAFAEV